MSVRLLMLVLLAAMTAAGACNCGGGGGGPCTADAQCDATGQGFSKCDLKTGACACVDDRACGPNEFCNGAGRCQAQSGCQTNDDCGSTGGEQGLFCDVTSSQCLSVDDCNPASGQLCCTLDDQCPFRQVCDVISRACVPGCHDDGDCLIGEGCSGAGFGRVGQCGTACTNDSLCPSSYLCNIATGLCEPDTRGPYCSGCSGGVESTDCGNFGNYCLTDTSGTGTEEFCGVECAQGQACPNAFSCQDVIIIPPAAPFCTFPEACVIPTGAASGACARTGVACNVNEDCPQGPPFGDCPDRLNGRHGSCEANTTLDCTTDADCPTGACDQIKCEGSEADGFGHCTCTRDSDCPTDQCAGADQSDPQHPVRGHCQLSGHPCFQDFECDVITCQQGGCLIGKNCAPSNDRTCADLTPVTPTP